MYIYLHISYTSVCVCVTHVYILTRTHTHMTVYACFHIALYPFPSLPAVGHRSPSSPTSAGRVPLHRPPTPPSVDTAGLINPREYAPGLLCPRLPRPLQFDRACATGPTAYACAGLATVWSGVCGVKALVRFRFGRSVVKRGWQTPKTSNPFLRAIGERAYFPRCLSRPLFAFCGGCAVPEFGG